MTGAADRHGASPGSLLHRVNLANVGGVEVSFAQYSAHRRASSCGDSLLFDGAVHPRFTAATDGLHPVHDRAGLKRWHGLRVPRVARRTRARLAARVYRRAAPTAVLAWNTFGNREVAAIAKALDRPLIYYEHGNAWRSRAPHAGYFLEHTAGIITNSHAAARILALRWGWQGPTARVYCAVAAQEIAEHARGAATLGRPLRLGAAGRLAEFKGQIPALHALAHLREQHGIDATLTLAGEGPARSRLAALAGRLGIEPAVCFAGLVDRMRDFYDRIDILLVPSLREPFGRVSIEAQARGCPVVVAGVDGLPETLAPGDADQVVVPRLPPSHYTRLGGDSRQLPPWVFDPGSDQLVEPHACAPEDLAAAVARLVASPQHYAAASARALDNVRKRFTETDYNDQLDAAIAQLVAVGAAT